MPRAGRAGAILLVALGAFALTGCTQESSGSRHTLYDGLDALAADSSAIVVGTVREQHAADDATVSTVEVTNVSGNPRLGENLASDRSGLAVGQRVDVRQQTEPLMVVGTEYLLFLTPTELSGDAASAYFVTGGDAGLYQRAGDEFRRVATDSGDALPETISIAD